MTTRRRRGEGGISFEPRGPCRPARHGNCPGLWRGELTLEYTGDGKRVRRKVGDATKAAVIDKLRDLRTQLDKGVTPSRLHPLPRPVGRPGLASLRPRRPTLRTTQHGDLGRFLRSQAEGILAAGFLTADLPTAIRSTSWP